MSPSRNPLAQQIFSTIVGNPHVDHRRVTVTSKSGCVLIQGTAKSFFEKQMAQEALRKIDGIESIENQLLVDA